jgi:hypothetical protein
MGDLVPADNREREKEGERGWNFFARLLSGGALWGGPLFALAAQLHLSGHGHSGASKFAPIPLGSQAKKAAQREGA